MMFITAGPSITVILRPFTEVGVGDNLGSGIRAIGVPCSARVFAECAFCAHVQHIKLFRGRQGLPCEDLWSEIARD